MIQKPFIGSVRQLYTKQATAKSENDKYAATNLADGKTSTFYASSDTITEHPWVQLELIDTESVKGIVITNRRDCCGERLTKVEIRVGDNQVTKENERTAILKYDLCGEYQGPAQDGEVVNIRCSTPLTGRYVTIQVTANEIQHMNIAEVMLYTKGSYMMALIN